MTLARVLRLLDHVAKAKDGGLTVGELCDQISVATDEYDSKIKALLFAEKEPSAPIDHMQALEKWLGEEAVTRAQAVLLRFEVRVTVAGGGGSERC